MNRIIERLHAAGAGAYPVLAATTNGVVAAWTSGGAGESTVAVRPVMLKE